jgi:hypothetical protein
MSIQDFISAITPTVPCLLLDVPASMVVLGDQLLIGDQRAGLFRMALDFNSPMEYLGNTEDYGFVSLTASSSTVELYSYTKGPVKTEKEFCKPLFDFLALSQLPSVLIELIVQTRSHADYLLRIVEFESVIHSAPLLLTNLKWLLAMVLRTTPTARP